MSGVQLTAQQKSEQVAKLATHLRGEWTCAGSSGNINNCFGEILTFSNPLDHLSIENYWRFCRLKSDYQITFGAEDADGLTDFTIHSNGLGQLVGVSITNADCKTYLATLSENPLTENFSLSHSEDWSKITIGDNNFLKASPSPSPSSSNQPSNP